MGKDSAEKYLDNLLNSISGISDYDIDDNSGDDSFEVDTTEEDFLKLFENELEAEAYNNYIADFEMELEAENNHDKSIDGFAEEDDSEELSLDQVLANAENVSELEAPKEESGIETAIEAFEFNSTEEEDDNGNDNVFPDEDSAVSEPKLAMTEADEPDLAGNADMSLEDMLGDDLSELGDMLSGEMENPLGDEFDDFAAKEMNEGMVSIGEPGLEEVQEPTKKKGFIARFLEALFGKDDDENQISEEPINDGLANLSEENAQILMELEDMDSDDKKKKGKKEKKAKEKKPKKEKPNKEKPKKEKKPKVKKEKKPKEKDNTPPLPKVPVIMIWIMVGSMFLFVILVTNLLGNQTNMSQANAMYDEGLYIDAFKKIDGLKIKESDQEFYDKLKLLASVSAEYNAYKSFISHDKQLMAFDSLICAAGRYVTYEEDAKTLGCEQELGALKESIETELTDKYKMTFDEATELYNAKDRKAYTVAIYKKLAQLGIAVE